MVSKGINKFRLIHAKRKSLWAGKTEETMETDFIPKNRNFTKGKDLLFKGIFTEGMSDFELLKNMLWGSTQDKIWALEGMLEVVRGYEEVLPEELWENQLLTTIGELLFSRDKKVVESSLKLVKELLRLNWYVYSWEAISQGKRLAQKLSDCSNCLFEIGLKWVYTFRKPLDKCKHTIPSDMLELTLLALEVTWEAYHLISSKKFIVL